MTDFERFLRNARSRGVLVDSNLLVLLVVGYVGQHRIPSFKRTSNYLSEDWDALTGILERIPRRYSIAHVLAEASNLTDLKGPEGEEARAILHKAISQLEEIPIASLDACASPYYRRLGLTDAVIGVAVRQRGCSVVTNDSGLYRALVEEGASVLNFDDLRKML
jgi:predicted nucleic acid-binding protein